MVGQGL
jgi:hypothetical protein